MCPIQASTIQENLLTLAEKEITSKTLLKSLIEFYIARFCYISILPSFYFHNRIKFSHFRTNYELQSHPMLAFEERSRLCRCLNYNKLSFEVCKDLAKNPRIPPMIAMQALISQQTKIPSSDLIIEESEIINPSQIILHYDKTDSFLEEKEDMRQNLERMEWRVKELEILCKEMKVQMSRFH